MIIKLERTEVPLAKGHLLGETCKLVRLVHMMIKLSLMTARGTIL